MTTTLSSKGQIVIPLDTCNRQGLPTGALMECNLQDGRIILTPVAQAGAAHVVAEHGYIALDAPEMTPQRVKDLLLEL